MARSSRRIMSGNGDEDESKRSFYFQIIFENVSATLLF
jgi:hypothetical protein